VAIDILKDDPAAIERFIEDMRLSTSEDGLERIVTL
jgi:hypothetical protein